MRRIINTILPITYIFIILTLWGCTSFTPPKGVWVCEELNITIDFDDNEGLTRAAINGRGVIVINGEERQIVCGMDPIGGAEILYADEINKHSSEREYLYTGVFKYSKKDEMVFNIVKDNTKYTFVKQE